MTAFTTARNELDWDTILVANLLYSSDEFGPGHRLSFGHLCPNVKHIIGQPVDIRQIHQICLGVQKGLFLTIVSFVQCHAVSYWVCNQCKQRITFCRESCLMPLWRRRQIAQDILWFSKYTATERLDHIDREWKDIQDFIREFGFQRYGTGKRSQTAARDSRV